MDNFDDKTRIFVRPEATEDLVAGDTLRELTIIEELGQGAMGIVYLASHKYLKTNSAVKVLPPIYANNPDFVARFQKEAETLAKMRHGNIVRVTDFGKKGDRYYLVLEYVEGGNIEEYLAKNGPNLPADEVHRILRDLLSGLVYAHSKGIVHRDLKPANLLIARDNRIKISDFGLARVLGTDFTKTLVESTVSIIERSIPAASLTGSTSSYVGTYDFMSPEARSGVPIDRRGDLYAVGVIAYYLLTGKKPVGRFKPATAFVKGLNKRWDRLIDRCLEPNIEDRYQTAEEILQDLAHLDPKRQRKFPWVPTALALLAGVAAGGLFFYNQQTGEVERYFEKFRPAAPETSASQSSAPEPVKMPEGEGGALGATQSTPPADAGGPEPESPPLEPAAPLPSTGGATLTAPVPESDAGSPPTEDEGREDMPATVIAPASPPPSAGPVEQEPATPAPSTRPARSPDEAAVDAGPAALIRAPLPNGVEMVFVRIGGGSFLMGSPENEARRRPGEMIAATTMVEQPVYMSAFEVTQAQYESIMGQSPSYWGGAMAGQLPVEQVTWEDLTGESGFLERLNRHLRAKGPKGYLADLPTESEWEYACRAGTVSTFNDGTVYAAGSAEPDLRAIANYDNREGKTIPAGRRKANAWGLYDMHGNVAEITRSVDGKPVVRGGSYRNSAGYLRSAARFQQSPGFSGNKEWGFRIVLRSTP